jgi:hypothetical protein
VIVAEFLPKTAFVRLLRDTVNVSLLSNVASRKDRRLFLTAEEMYLEIHHCSFLEGSALAG